MTLTAAPLVDGIRTTPARVRRTLPVLGPAFVAAIAYADPGNFATNFAGGARYGYLLLWVIVAANVMAMLVQTLSATVGIATGRTLPELCRENFPRPVTVGLWVQAEAVAIATDLAEVIGGALALYLLFGIPLPLGGLITGVVAMALLTLRRRRFELVIAGLFGVILCGMLAMLLGAGVSTPEAAGGLVPRLEGTDSLLLAVGMLGATVMPHAVYLHSGLTAGRLPGVDKLARARATRVDVLLAMGLAGCVNAAMLLVAAALFDGRQVETLTDVHAGLGGIAALVFALALLASGLASSGVGTYAGQVVMQGFLRRRIPLAVRRLLTLAPAVLLLAVGVDPTAALVWSQVVLSFGIPFALVPLVLLARRRDLMGSLATSTPVTAAAWAVAAVVSGLNLFLLSQAF
ncbi:MAG: Manganese transport protein MntH [uncultured Corynebacteriales bacterium]|uniref:Manganese transport protein MntH n=1 Tax=uncultured Mycobacteriales bacterium TaxID=581187 RepID=A0A6J4JHE4_9ACTN|nr:MAG: Manganese transport protein MntH [uncultured Corynebacteriales bacterium]